MKVAICVPCRGQIEQGTAFDLARLVGHTQQDVKLYTSLGTLIFDQRNKMVEDALFEGADYILFIDADMRFPTDTLDRMLAHQKKIVAVNATTRSIPVKPTSKTVQINEDGSIDWIAVSSKDKTGIEKVDAAGTGIMLIASEVFKLEKPWFYFEQLPNDKLLGEDVYFCIKAKDAGIDTYIDHDLSREIGHIGSYTYGWKDIT